MKNRKLKLLLFWVFFIGVFYFCSIKQNSNKSSDQKEIKIEKLENKIKELEIKLKKYEK